MCTQQNRTTDITPAVSRRESRPGDRAQAATGAVASDGPDAYHRIAAGFLPANEQPESGSACAATESHPAQPLRRKIWELDSGVHCAVVGTCLTLRELQQLLRKTSLRLPADASDYDIHRAFVGLTHKSCKAAKFVQKHLDQKYRQLIRESARLHSPAELERLWETSVRDGEVAGAFWTLLTHPQIPVSLVNRIYADVHMLSHLSGASVRIDLQELARAKRRLEDLRTVKSQSETALRRQLKANDAEIKRLRKQIQALDADLKTRTREWERLAPFMDTTRVEQLCALNRDLTEQLAQCIGHLERSQDESEEWKRIARRSADRNSVLEGRLAEAYAERDALETSLRPLLALHDAAANRACAEPPCEARDLCGQNILYVGGRAGQCAHFRELVERSNGHFLHHDGGREDNPRRLGSVLSKADAVLCPLDCVSHDAVNRLKRLCETKAKPLVLIPRASLASFVRGLGEVA